MFCRMNVRIYALIIGTPVRFVNGFFEKCRTNFPNICLKHLFEYAIIILGLLFALYFRKIIFPIKSLFY